jgi:dolichyl-phosphate-mannose--protein O-mannosyl transferase
LGLFFIPNLLWPNYGLELNDKYSVFLSQHTTIFLGGIAIISFLFRDVEEKSVYAKKILTGLLWTNILGVIITLYAIYTGVFYGFGWSDPTFFALLSIVSYVKLKHNQ